MNKNEWLTIRTILSLEFDKAIRDYGLPTDNLIRSLNNAYYNWVSKVERHVHINEAQLEVTPQEQEIIEGFAQVTDSPALTPLEIEYMSSMLKIIREK